jgi:hypothetical protein
MTIALMVSSCVMSLPLAAQTFQVLYTFHGSDGAYPVAGLTMDGGGRLYGSTYYGGTGGSCGGDGCGTVFQLVHRGTGWILNPLRQFTGDSNGKWPDGRVLFGPGGLLYGTASSGGVTGGEYPQGCGAVVTLRPPAMACHTALCPWTETVIHEFQGSEGALPSGELAFDQAGDVFGTTFSGGSNFCVQFGCGTVYKLTHAQGGWTQSTLYQFSGQTGTGYFPNTGVTIDPNGNLFGTTGEVGAVFELSPDGGGWTETTLPPIANSNYVAGVVRDPAGNLYGGNITTVSSPPSTLFEYSPSGGGWTLTTLHNFPQFTALNGTMTLDAAGNLYGVTIGGTAGEVFKLTPTQGGWTYTTLYAFTGGADGGSPFGRVILDANGNIYGTTQFGGDNNLCQHSGCGVVWEITP